MGVLLSVDEWDSKPEPAFDIDISDLAGLIEESWSVLPGSLRERCCRTLIMASFSMIWACRVLILFEKCKEKQCTCTLVSLGWGSQCPHSCDYNSLGHLGRHTQDAMELTALNTGCLPACQSRSRMRISAHMHERVALRYPPTLGCWKLLQTATEGALRQSWELHAGHETNKKMSINTLWGVCTGPNPRENTSVGLSRGGWSPGSDEDALKREVELARCKKSKTRLFCISPRYQDRFWVLCRYFLG